jgi:tRNA threonylcarbamoyl adenosine modification protein YeaZ
MYSIALDTSAGTTVAVLKDDLVLAELNFDENMTHAERIGEALSDVLSKAAIRAAQIDRVVVGMGPGPFTGLRVGLAAAKFFALGANAELVGVCSLDAIALSFYERNPEAGALLVLTDARRKEVFWAAYSGMADGIPIRVVGPSVTKEENIKDFIDVQSHQRTELLVTASALGKIAFSENSTELGANYDVSPIYLREPDAVPGKGKRVSS